MINYASELNPSAGIMICGKFNDFLTGSGGRSEKQSWKDVASDGTGFCRFFFFFHLNSFQDLLNGFRLLAMCSLQTLVFELCGNYP